MRLRAGSQEQLPSGRQPSLHLYNHSISSGCGWKPNKEPAGTPFCGGKKRKLCSSASTRNRRRHDAFCSWQLRRTIDMARRYSPSASKDVKNAMHKRKRGTLKSGGSGKTVQSKKQAIAIGLSEARKKGKKVPRKRKSR